MRGPVDGYYCAECGQPMLVPSHDPTKEVYSHPFVPWTLARQRRRDRRDAVAQWASVLSEAAQGVGVFLALGVLVVGPIVGFAYFGSMLLVRGYLFTAIVVLAAALVWPFALSALLRRIGGG